MNASRGKKLVIVAFAAFAIMGVLMSPRSKSQAGCGCVASLFSTTALASDVPLPTVSAPMPRLVDIGASRCIPCKMMAPILEELKKEYMGRMQVDFIDVFENPDAGKKYAIQMIPTQIFYDASGKELFRHEGFISKARILAKWKELGVVFGDKKEVK